MRIKHFISTCLLLYLCCGVISVAADSKLEKGFAQPPDQAKPWCYWYWISDNISKDGLTKDLEAMARVGIREALIGNIFLDEAPAGRVKVLSEEWWQMIEHAIREGGRLGVDIGLFNCPGWSQSGGPWISPGQTMRYLTSSEIWVTGPQRFDQKLSAPNKEFQDVAALAFPVPANDADTLATRSPRVSFSPEISGAEKLVDGRRDTKIMFPKEAGQGGKSYTLDVALDAPLTARTLQLFPADDPFSVECELLAEVGGQFQSVRRIHCDWSNLSTAVGFMPQAPVAVTFPPVTAQRFRLVFSGISYGHRNFKPAHAASLAEINLSGAARLENFVEKQMGKMQSTPIPRWDTYLWPTPPEPEAKELVVAPERVVDLSGQLAADGTLRWDVPPGDWVILRTGMTPTGMSNSPASREGQGLEVDKMNRELAQHHFDSFIGQLLRRMPAKERKALKHVVADSYEMGALNWTDGFGAVFRKRYGYDARPWLPVLTGRIVGSADQSERFLWDLRRLVADRVATEYVGGLRAACRKNGLKLWLENYGHWGYPGEFLLYGRESDAIGGEFWVTGDLGSIECRAASSCANIYGKRFVSAESFTGGPAFQNSPGALKARGDWSFSEGINHVVLHVYIHQPWEDKVPGVNAPWGTEFNRHNTWFERGKAWVDYETRACWLLQQGNRVADVAYFIGEDTPKMTGTRQPELPAGFDFDYVNADVLERLAQVKNGRLTLASGPSYRVLVLPPQETMRPGLLQKIRDLVKAGAVVVGAPPTRSPSLQNFPQSDAAVRQLAQELWGSGAAVKGERPVGKGRVFSGMNLEEVFARLAVTPDFESDAPMRFTHRRDGDTDIYFVANPKSEPANFVAAFRVAGKTPELWWPHSGTMEQPAVYRVTEAGVNLPLQLGPHGSVCVVFRSKAGPQAEQVVAVRRAGEELLRTTLREAVAASSTGRATNNFSFAVWVQPEDDTGLVGEAASGTAALGLGSGRNDALFPPHGDNLAGPGHAGAGLAVGRNGVCVLEHGAGYFAATLVQPAVITNWTHLVVVYREGQPTLYLDGRPVRTGLRSSQRVLSGVGHGGGAPFRGRLGSFESFARSLSDEEVARLFRTMAHPETKFTGGDVKVTRTGKARQIEVRTAGNYELTFGDGRTREVRVTNVPPPLTLEGPWEVRFAPGWGAPERITFDQLDNWVTRPEPGIKYYSGAAIYQKTFTMPSAFRNPANTDRVLLDLGEVRDVATVRLNGRELATLWLAPWEVDLTPALRPGENTLEVEVINPWNNRLVGDALLPAAQRRTFISVPTVTKDSALLPAGLLGPVRILTTRSNTQR
jgi:hypothetical protein